MQDPRDDYVINDLMQDRVPKKCPFCGAIGMKLIFKRGWLYDAESERFVRDIDEAIQVFCYECDEEILREDVK